MCFIILLLFVMLCFGIINILKHGIVVIRLFIKLAFIGPFKPCSKNGFRLFISISFFIENIAIIKRKINISVNIWLILDIVSIPLFKVKYIVIDNVIIIYRILVSYKYWDTIKLLKLNIIVELIIKNNITNI